jgi:hypothetical protein
VIVGVLATRLPLAHLFTLDAASFVVSALTLLVLRLPPVVAGTTQAVVAASAGETWRLVMADAGMRWLLLTRLAGNAAWAAAFYVAMPLLASRELGGGVEAYAAMAAAYGAGNVAGNLLFALRPMRHGVTQAFLASLLLGGGFVVIALAPSLEAAAAGAAIAAVGGPMGDLPMTSMIQTRLPALHLGRAFGLRSMIEGGGCAVGLLLAAWLDALFGARGSIAFAAIALAALGGVGLARFGMQARVCVAE